MSEPQEYYVLVNCTLNGREQVVRVLEPLQGTSQEDVINAFKSSHFQPATSTFLIPVGPDEEALVDAGTTSFDAVLLRDWATSSYAESEEFHRDASGR